MKGRRRKSDGQTRENWKKMELWGESFFEQRHGIIHAFSFLFRYHPPQPPHGLMCRQQQHSHPPSSLSLPSPFPSPSPSPPSSYGSTCQTSCYRPGRRAQKVDSPSSYTLHAEAPCQACVLWAGPSLCHAGGCIRSSTGPHHVRVRGQRSPAAEEGVCGQGGETRGRRWARVDALRERSRTAARQQRVEVH